MRTVFPKSLMASAALLALLAGCSLQPVYQRPAAPVGAAFPAGAVYERQPGAASPEGQARSADGRAAADIGWRDFFADPRLQAIVGLALQNNRDLRVSMLNVEAARAQYQITRASLLPTVDGTASATRQRTPTNLSSSGRNYSTVYSVGASVSWEIDFFGRVGSLRDQALAQYLSLAETRKAAEIALVSQVAVQYLTMLGDEDQLAVTRATLKNAQESLRINQLSYDNGVATELDLQQAQGIFEQASASLEAYSRARAQDENALVLLVGQQLPADLPAGLPLVGQQLLTDIPAGLPSELLQRRPDIAAAEQALRAANANIGAARAAFFPSVSLTGDFGTLSPTTGGLFRGAQRSWSFAPQISVPIFSGGALAANLELAQVQKRIEIADYERSIQTAFREVSDGLAARGTYDRQIQSLQRYEASQRRRLELSDMRYKNGVDDYLSVLQAQTDLFGAQQSLVSARLARAANLVTLYKALGGGWIANSGEPPRDAAAADPVLSSAAPKLKPTTESR
ncbi:efflux transporter outer membrane subunit [Xylophilus rhododendri]|uniref:Efflux transporter outer membrane subunit n=1 Tax=Xylophilus rhododendri TaxID=2697032 RepID=A0A857J8Q1_9BURK|nr:efflux transporter outer membrane subunit [Xylophilus rhododendri]QHI99138.1 efflux transporter outer membrane subunit [Xylophilus rhododendri]